MPSNANSFDIGGLELLQGGGDMGWRVAASCHVLVEERQVLVSVPQYVVVLGAVLREIELRTGEDVDQIRQPLDFGLPLTELVGVVKVGKSLRAKPIKFHGMRHTVATLLLQAGQPVHVVSERLGHSKVSMTMEVYAHVLPDMQREAASTLSAI